MEVVRVMLGSDKWYSQHFPHSIDPKITFGANDLPRLKREGGITLTNLVDIKINPNEDFALLTMEDYIHFSSNIAPLCLPKNPNKAYNEEVVEAETYGFGLDEQAPREVAIHAHWEKWYSPSKAAEDNIGKVKQEDTPVISRRRCLQQFGDLETGKLPSKADDNNVIYGFMNLLMYDFHFA